MQLNTPLISVVQKAQRAFGTAALTSFGLGFLFFLGASQLFHETHESHFTLVSIVAALSATGIGYVIGRLLVKHLSVCSHARIDNPKDVAFLAIIIIGSLVHTLLDGSVIHTGLSISFVAGTISLLAIVSHEIIRTSILYAALRTMQFQKSIARIAVFGISIIGIASGVVLSRVVLFNGAYEDVAHLVSGGLLIAVATDLYYYLRQHGHKIKIGYITLGLALVIVIEHLHGVK